MNETVNKTPANSSAGMGLGIAGLILGILSIPFGILGCTFIMALIFGILGITLSSVAFSQAKQANAPSGLIVAALIISILGTSFALLRITTSPKHKADIIYHWKDKLEEFEENSDEIELNFEKAFREGFEDAIDEEGESMEDELESLEEELEGLGDDIEISLDDLNDKEKAQKLGRATGKAVKGFVDEMNDTADAENTD
jgi:hypothetical protein